MCLLRLFRLVHLGHRSDLVSLEYREWPLRKGSQAYARTGTDCCAKGCGVCGAVVCGVGRCCECRAKVPSGPGPRSGDLVNLVNLVNRVDLMHLVGLVSLVYLAHEVRVVSTAAASLPFFTWPTAGRALEGLIGQAVRHCCYLRRRQKSKRVPAGKASPRPPSKASPIPALSRPLSL